MSASRQWAAADLGPPHGEWAPREISPPPGFYQTPQGFSGASIPIPSGRGARRPRIFVVTNWQANTTDVAGASDLA